MTNNTSMYLWEAFRHTKGQKISYLNFASNTENKIEEKTKICTTCGCSLVRLGISEQQVVSFQFKSVLLFYCCQGCLTLFQQNPDMYLEETSDIVVCPTCLSEKPIASTVAILIEDQKLNFCRCPYCLDTFNKNRQYYVDRLYGKTDFKGLYSDDEEACCHWYYLKFYTFWKSI